MRNVKLINGLLWVVNALLGAGIVVFAFQYLLFPAEIGPDPNFDREDYTARPPPQTTVSDMVMKSLRNPMVPGAGAGAAAVTTFRATLKGVFPSQEAKSGAAFLKTGNVELVAYVGETILYDGKPYPDLAGWTLKEVTKDSAVFVGPGGDRATVKLDPGLSSPVGGGPAAPGGPPGAKVNRAGQPYQPQAFRSQLLTQTDTRQVWGIDVAEIDWAFQNQDRILDSDFQITPYPGGGVRVESVQPNSIGAARGLVAGDVIREVNGAGLTSLADAKNLLANPALRQQGGLKLVVERAGKTMSLEYRPIR